MEKTEDYREGMYDAMADIAESMREKGLSREKIEEILFSLERVDRSMVETVLEGWDEEEWEKTH